MGNLNQTDDREYKMNGEIDTDAKKSIFLHVKQ